MSSLFRKEALEHSQNRLFGEVVLLQPMSVTVLVSTVVVICALILAILFWGTYARKETVRGYIVPDKGIVKLYAQNSGNIAEIHVEDGEYVEEGQTLVTIITERSLQGGSDIDTLQLEELESSKNHNYQRIEAEKAILKSETMRLQNTIEGTEKELEQINKSIETQEELLAILDSRLAAARKLYEEKKTMSESEYQRYLQEMLDAKKQLQDLERAKLNKENALIQAEGELAQLPIRYETKINEIEDKISEINQRIAETQGRRVYVVRAPISGRVTSVQAKLGQYQGNNLPLLSIIPEEATMQVELFVPTRAIGFIEEGQTVRIRFDAFPYQRFGIFEGEVLTISKNVQLPNEIMVPLELKEPVYRVVVKLKRQDVTAYGKSFPLQAGMSLEADIILDRQTLFEWILDPIFSLKGRF